MTPHWPALLDRSAATPLWRQLLADLRSRLASRAFDDGFPGELQLMEQYAVSRHTVREALRQLRAEGVITTGRGRRRRLVSPEDVIIQPTGIVYSLFSSVESSGQSQLSVIRALDVRADGVVAVRLGLEESTPLFYLERLRMAGGLPLALDRVWMPASIAEPLLTVDFTHTSLYAELFAATGISVTGGDETVRAVVPSRAEHEILELTAPSAALAVDRTASSQDIPIEWRHTLVRADRFCLTSALKAGPQTGSATGAVPVRLAVAPTAR